MNKRINYNKYDSGNAFFLSIVFPQIVAVILSLLIFVIGAICGQTQESLLKDPFVLTVITLSPQLTFIFLFFMYNKKTNVNWLKATGINKKFSYVNLVVCIFISAISIFGFNGLIYLIDKVVALTGYKMPMEWPIPIDNAGWFILNLIGLAILPAIFEELLYRGIILNGLREKGMWKSIVFSAFLFALLHGNIIQFAYPFILGIILGFVVYKTKNVLYSIIIHMTNNLFSVIYQYVITINKVENVLEPKINVANVFIILGVALVAVLMVFLLIKFVLKKDKSESNEKLGLKQEEKHEMTLDDIKIEEESSVNETKINITKPVSNKFMQIGIVIGVVLWIMNFITGIM